MMVSRRLARMDGYILSYETSGWRMRDDETCIEENIIELRGRDKVRRPKKGTRRVRKLEHGIDKWTSKFHSSLIANSLLMN